MVKARAVGREKEAGDGSTDSPRPRGGELQGPDLPPMSAKHQKACPSVNFEANCRIQKPNLARIELTKRAADYMLPEEAGT